MIASEYRQIITRQRKTKKQGKHDRYPPCMKCSDAKVEQCAATGHECSRFKVFAGFRENNAKH